MNSDKIIIIIALIIGSTVFALREEIIADARLFTEFQDWSDEKFLLTKIDSQPLSLQERKEVLTAHIGEMKGIQKRVSKSVFTKNFLDVDFSDYILEAEKELKEVEDEAYTDDIYFKTGNGNVVIAAPQFPKESLLKFGFLIDQILFEKEPNGHIYQMDLKDELIVIQLSLEEDRRLDKRCYRAFVNQVSQEVFDNHPVALYLLNPDTNKRLIFKSKSVNPINLSGCLK